MTRESFLSKRVTSACVHADVPCDVFILPNWLLSAVFSSVSLIDPECEDPALTPGQDLVLPTEKTFGIGTNDVLRFRTSPFPTFLLSLKRYPDEYPLMLPSFLNVVYSDHW